MKLLLCALWLNAERFYYVLTIPLKCELRKKCIVGRRRTNERALFTKLLRKLTETWHKPFVKQVFVCLIRVELVHLLEI